MCDWSSDVCSSDLPLRRNYDKSTGMIIYNTTYHVHNSVDAQFREFIKTGFVPRAIESGVLSSPRLALIMARQEGDEGLSYSLQFNAATLDELQEWYHTTGTELLDEITRRFNTSVMGFSTLMSDIEI